MNRTLCLIGCGQMGSAIVRGVARADHITTPDFYFCDARHTRAEELAKELSGEPFVVGNVSEIQGDGRVFLVAVKPHVVREVLESIVFEANDVVISVAAGLTLESLESWVNHDGVHVVRTMPNTPCLVGQGVTGIFGHSEIGLQVARDLFEAVGRVVELEREKHFHGLTAISGSGPAYVFTMLEALADGGVLAGLDRTTARALAVETFAGAAALVKSSDVHTAELKDRVASPGGTTIAALRELERHGLRDALISAVEAAAKRSKQMGS